MKRGEIWTLQDRQYASKARPVLIIQSDKQDVFDSCVLCLFTTYDSARIKTRVFIEASAKNGLHKDSYIMTEKIVTVDKRMLGERIGVLSSTEMREVSKQLKVILDL